MSEEKSKDLWKQTNKIQLYGFWIAIVILIPLAIGDPTDMVIEHGNNPKQSGVKMIVNKTMTMPNITFCMSKKQAWSHFKIDPKAPVKEWDQIVQDQLANMTDAASFLTAPWDYRLVMEAYEVIATLNSMERETTPQGAARSMTNFKVHPRLAGKRKLIRTWMNAIKKRNVTFTEFTQKTGYETLRRSLQRFMRTSYDGNKIFKTDIKISWISMMNFCFQPEFDADNFDDIKSQGQFFILQMFHQGRDGEFIDCMTVDFHGRPSALARFMEGDGRVRDGISDELCLGMAHEVTVEVRGIYTMMENNKPGTACNVVEEGEDTEFDCRSRCRLEMIKQMCNCIAPSLSYLKRAADEDLPICDYEKCEVDMRRTFSDRMCAKKCLKDCRQIRYEVKLDQKGRSVRPDLTTITLNWGSFEYLSQEQKFEPPVAKPIAVSGGFAGI